MEEIFFQIKKRSTLRKIAGILMIALGLLFYLIPLVPGTWAVVLGLEILGVRLLVQDKLMERARNSKLFKSKK